MSTITRSKNFIRHAVVCQPILCLLALFIPDAGAQPEPSKAFRGCYDGGREVSCSDSSSDSPAYRTRDPRPPTAEELAADALNGANWLSDQGRFDEAEDSLREAIRLRPGYGKAYANLGNIFLRQRKFAEAESAYQTALRNCSNCELPPIYFGLAQALWHLQKLDEAEQAFKRAGDNPEAKRLLSELQESRRKQTEAALQRKRYEEAAALERKREEDRKARTQANVQKSLDELIALVEAERAKNRTTSHGLDFVGANGPVVRDSSMPRSYPKLQSYTEAQKRGYASNESGNTFARIGDWLQALNDYEIALMQDPDGPFSSVIKENIEIAKKHLEQERPRKPTASQSRVPPAQSQQRAAENPPRDVVDSNCTGWMRQPNGGSYRLCMDEGAHRYCEQSSGAAISRVNCQRQ